MSFLQLATLQGHLQDPQSFYSVMDFSGQLESRNMGSGLYSSEYSSTTSTDYSSDLESHYVYSLHPDSAPLLKHTLSSHGSDSSDTSAQHSLDYASRDQGTIGLIVEPYPTLSQGERGIFGYSGPAHSSLPNPIAAFPSNRGIKQKSTYNSPNTSLVALHNRRKRRASFTYSLVAINHPNFNTTPVLNRQSPNPQLSVAGACDHVSIHRGRNSISYPNDYSDVDLNQLSKNDDVSLKVMPAECSDSCSIDCRNWRMNYSPRNYIGELIFGQ